MTNPQNALDETAPQSVINTTVSTLFNSNELQRTSQIRALLTASVSCQPEVVEATLKKDPSLALEKLEAKDFVTAPTGHRFNLKPYQAALAVQDFKVAKIIKFYLTPAEAHRQFNEQKENETVTANEKPIFDQLNRLAKAIYYDKENGFLPINGTLDDNGSVALKKDSLVQKELNEFWRLLDATLDEVITPGKRPFIPDQLLLRALYRYEKDYFNLVWGACGYRDSRALLFVHKVMGYNGIQRFMPVNYIQDFYNATVPKEYAPYRDHNRKIYQFDKLLLTDFYPLRPRSSYNSDFFLMEVTLDHLSRRWNWDAQNWLLEIMSNKQNEMAELKHRNGEMCSIS